MVRIVVLCCPNHFKKEGFVNWSELSASANQRVLNLENELSGLAKEKLAEKTDAAVTFLKEEIIRNCDIESDFDFSTIDNAENAVYIATVKALELIFSDLYTGSGNSVYREKSIKFGSIYRRDFKMSVENLTYSTETSSGRFYLKNTFSSIFIR